MLFLQRSTTVLTWIGVCLGAQTHHYIRRQESSTTTENAAPPTPTICGDIINYVNEGNNLFYASYVFECLVSVPFNRDVALRFIDYYNTTMQFQSTLSYLRNPPSTYQQPSVDFLHELRNIKTNVISGHYRNQYAFEADVQHLVQSLHDTHVNLVGGALSAFSFGSNTPLMTLSPDGIKTPEIYFQHDVQNRQKYAISPITQINGEDAVVFLSNFAALNAYGSLEPHGDWNNIMYSPIQDVLNIYDVFTMNAPFYWGDYLNFTMANGTVVETFWSALYTHPAFTGPLTTGGDYYNYFVLGLVPASYNKVPLPCPWLTEPTDQCPHIPTGSSRPAEITSWFEKTNGAFPNATMVAQPGLSRGDGGGTVTGYILDDISVGVLSIPSFSAFGWEIGNFSATIDDFIRKAQAKNTVKVIIDLQGNTGGLAELAISVFSQFFPQHYPFGGSRRRNHKLADVLGTSFTEHWTTLAADDDEKVDLAANEWVITDRLNAQTRQNFTSWAEYFGPIPEENGDNFSLVEQYDLANRVFDFASFQQWAPENYLDGHFNSSASSPWASHDVVLLTDGACSSACTLFVEMMSHQARVRTVVVGGRPEAGPMQATSGSRGALAYSASNLDNDIAISSRYLRNEALPDLNSETGLRDKGMFVITAGFNLRDQVRSLNRSEPPLQFSYDAADCRLYWTLDNALNMTRLWRDAAGAIWGLGVKASCVPGSTGYASPGADATATLAAPESTTTRVPSLPALEWNYNAPPSEAVDPGLIAGSLAGYLYIETPAVGNLQTCDQKGRVGPSSLTVCAEVDYQCSSGQWVSQNYVLGICTSAKDCGPEGFYQCTRTDDYTIETTHAGTVGQHNIQGHVARPVGICYPYHGYLC